MLVASGKLVEKSQSSIFLQNRHQRALFALRVIKSRSKLIQPHIQASSIYQVLRLLAPWANQLILKHGCGNYQELGGGNCPNVILFANANRPSRHQRHTRSYAISTRFMHHTALSLANCYWIVVDEQARVGGDITCGVKAAY